MVQGKDRYPRWLIGLALTVPIVYTAAELYLFDGALGFPLDDSWIHLQFARNLAGGLGLCYTAGELVTGSTAPLWTALLSLLVLVPGPLVLWAKLLGVGMHLGTVQASYYLGREMALPAPLAAAAAAFVASTSWLAWSALAAMEVGLFCVLATWGTVLVLRERRTPSRLPVGLAVLTLSALARPEGVLLVLLAVIERGFAFRRTEQGLRLHSTGILPVLKGIGVGGLAVLPVAALYVAVGGSPLPTTFATKAGYQVGGMPSGQFLDLVHGILFQAQPVATLLAPVGIAALLARLGTGQDRGLLAAAWVVALPLAYGVLGGGRSLVGNFGRYFFVLFPALVVLAATGWHFATRDIPRRLLVGPLSVRWRPLVLLLLFLPTLGAVARGAGLYTRSVANVHDSDLRMARLLEGVLPVEAVLAVNDIGALGYHLPNRLVDLAGIASPEIHQYARRAFERTGDYRVGILDFLEATEPDYVLLFPDWLPALDRLPGFEPIHRLEIPDNITMGGDELVLYRTPWTRHELTGPFSGGAGS